ncbi:MAG: hypothetical protein QG635_1056 [Bacteroidota bacterium]|nr:hypothetical protein [Bacteroidota bacterium]
MFMKAEFDMELIKMGSGVGFYMPFDVFMTFGKRGIIGKIQSNAVEPPTRVCRIYYRSHEAGNAASKS